MMNRHKCKLCTKSFSNGKALGGHMRSHLLPLPPSKRARHPLNESSASSSSNSQLLQQLQKQEDKGGVTTCALTRENPKKKKKKKMKMSVKATDPEFLCAGSSVVQEFRETAPNPSRKQLDRTDQSPQGTVAPEKEEVPITSESATGSVVPMSCVVVSDGSRDEEGARCLMMLSMDKWVSLKEDRPLGGRNDRSYPRLKPGSTSSHSSKLSRAKYKCLFCRKNFRSPKALSGHKAAGKLCRDQNAGEAASASVEKIYECPFCFKAFGSGQALGGHKRSHLLAPSSSSSTTTTATATGRDNLSSHTLVTVGNCSIDLNSPAPVEDDDFFHCSLMMIHTIN